MKHLLLILAMVILGIVLKAQDTFFPTKEGTVLVYQIFDKKDKASNTLKYTILQVETRGSDMNITYLIESRDPKDELVFKDEITIQKKGELLYMDMSNFINKAAFQQEGEIPGDVFVSGNNMELPSNPKPGEQLPDANVEMAMKLGFVNMKMMAEVTNRKVEAIEDVTVKAGTFNAYKFSSDVNSSAMGIKMKSANIDWYAKGVGIVKSENYDKNGKLQSRTELIEMH